MNEKISAAEAEAKYVADPSEAESVKAMPSGENTRWSGEDVGFNALWSMLNRSLFFDYFAHVADRKFLDADPRVRVQKQREEHHFWYGFAIVADTVVKVATVVIVVTVATALAVKIIA